METVDFNSVLQEPNLNLDLEEVRMSFMVSPIGVYIVQDRKFWFSNPKFQEITGYSEAELSAKDPLELVVPEDRQRVRDCAIQMLKRERNEPYQFRITDKSGEIRWIMETVASIVYKDRRAVLGNFMDVTENEKIRQAIVSSPIGIYIVADRQFVFVNPRFQEITGYSEPELIGKHPMECVIPTDRMMVRRNAIHMLKGILKEPYQFRVMHKSGSLRWILETVSSIRYNGRRAVLGNFMDITRSKEIEAGMKESERKYRAVFTLAREGIVCIDYEDGSIVDSNREFHRQTGYTAEALKQKKIWEIQPVELQEEAKEAYFRFRESCGGIISWKLVQGADKIVPVELVAQKMMYDGREAILCMVRDVTEREAMMRALTLASEEWRKSFDAIQDSVMLIDPDFRIQRANLAAGYLVRKDARTLIGEKCYELFHGTPAPPDYCPHIKSQISGSHCETEQHEPHLGKTLHFSASPIRDEEGHTTHTVEIITDTTQRRLQEQESIRLSRALADSFKGITVSLSDLVETRDPYTAGHSRHVAELAVLAGKEFGLDEESLQGLRVCAILHDIGKVIIPAAILNKPGRLSEYEWGMIRQHPKTAYETLQHIPFPWPVAEVVYQHHERLDGTGYPRGLFGSDIHLWARIIAIADIVDAMTSHRPYRPRMPRQNALDELERGSGILYDPKLAETFLRVLRLHDNRILLLDPDTDNLKMLVEALKIDGLEALGFREASPAMEIFKKKPFPLVLTELNLPETDGTQIAKKVKEINPDSEVIIMTHYGGKEEMLRALRAGASDFLEKPLDLMLLRKSVNRALQRFSGKSHL